MQAGPRPRLVAITLNPFSMLGEGTTVINTHGLPMQNGLGMKQCGLRALGRGGGCVLAYLGLAFDLAQP